MSKQKTWAATRKIVGDRHGYHCCHCKVPTAATIEHLQPRSKQGEHSTDNLRLACPSCNARRGNEDLASWQARKGWRLPAPSPPPSSLREVLALFGYPRDARRVETGSTNAWLKIAGGAVIAVIRAGKGYPWIEVRIGDADDPRVVPMAWGFLARHNTPLA